MAIFFVTYASPRLRSPRFCYAFSLTHTAHATMPRILDMMVVIYWNIKRIVLGAKTTLCEMKACPGLM